MSIGGVLYAMPAIAAAAAADSDVTRPPTQYLVGLTANTDDDSGSEQNAGQQRETKPERIINESSGVRVGRQAHQ